MATSIPPRPVIGAPNRNGGQMTVYDQRDWDRIYGSENAPINPDQTLTPLEQGRPVMSGTNEEAGRNNASIYYGSSQELGRSAADYRARIKNQLDQPSAMANQYRQAKGKEIKAMARKSGMSGTNLGANIMAAKGEGQRQQATMQQESNRQALSAYGKSIGAGISGTESLAASGAGRAIAATPTPTPDYGGTLGCFALVSLGLMSKETYASESPFVNKDSYQYIGYMIMISPLMPLVFKSRKFAKFASFFAHKYVYNLTGKEKNIIGKALSFFGSTVCTLVGRMSCKRKGVL